MLAFGFTEVTINSPAIVGALAKAEVESVFLDAATSALRPPLPFRLAAITVAGPRSHKHGRGIASMVSEDREEREVALRHATEQLAWASERGCGRALVRFGAPQRMRPFWEIIRDRFVRGELASDESLGILGERAVLLEAAHDHARAALDKLSREAERRHIVLALCNPRRFIELPSPDEADGFLRELRGAPLATWFDGPAAHLTSAMGLWTRDWLQRVFSPGDASACFVGDACGPIGALAPGRGALGPSLNDWIGHGEAPIFVPWNGLRDDESVAAFKQMRSWLMTRGASKS